LSLRT